MPIASSCTLCSQIRECLEKEIDGQAYDICSECWRALAEKLLGKGRPGKHQQPVILPSPGPRREQEDEKSFPGGPPKIWLSNEPD